MALRCLYKLALWAAAAFFAVVLLVCLFSVGLWSVLLAAGALAVLFAARRPLAGVSEQGARRAFWVLFGAFVLAAGAFAFAVRVEPAWDFGRVYHGALEITSSGSIQIDWQYFLESNNNFFLALALAPVFVAGSLAGLSPLASGILLNLAAIDGSILLLWDAARRRWGARRALAVAMACFGCAGLWLYGSIFYTDTLSMPFVSLGLWLAQRWSEGARRPALAAAMGLAAFLAFRLKPTAFFLYLALVLLWALRRGGAAKAAALGLAVFAACMALWQVWLGHNSVLDTSRIEEYRLPPLHYVMMGLKNPGGYDEADHFASQALPDAAARTEFAKGEIARRLADYGPLGFLDHLRQKLAYTWADGSWYGAHKLGIDPVSPGVLQQWVADTGGYWPLFRAAANGAQLLVCLGLAACAFDQARRGDKADSLLWSCLVALLGVGLFLLVWETRSRYLVGVLPLILPLCARGLGVLLRTGAKN